MLWRLVAHLNDLRAMPGVATFANPLLVPLGVSLVRSVSPFSRCTVHGLRLSPGRHHTTLLTLRRVKITLQKTLFRLAASHSSAPIRIPLTTFPLSLVSRVKYLAK